MNIRVHITGILAGLLMPVLTFAGVIFTEYFTDKTLRYDFILGGNHETVVVYPQQMLEEPYWAGSRVHLTDELNYGTYRFRVFDRETGKQIYSRGFATLFQEWQTTAEAKKTDRAFYQAVRFPFPLKPVLLYIDYRTWEGVFQTVFETEIDPSDYFIRREMYPKPDLTYLEKNGEPDKKVDLIFLAEGYTENERDKFLTDAREMTDYLLSVAPFTENRMHFNIGALWTPSGESGTDIPGRGIYRDTRFNSTFYTFDIDRYLTTSDMRSVYDALTTVPWDHTFILVNSTQYGGGGFFNFLGIGTSSHYLSKKVMVHEFGHSFAGLGDEYYDSAVAYENYYNLETEPWEPNITTMIDFASKWQDMVPVNVPVPTPRNENFNVTVGVFEGGGYMSHGIFSPVIDCRMKSNAPEDFCPVCQRAIVRMIRTYSE